MKKWCVLLALLSLISVIYAEKFATLKELIKPDGMAVGNDRFYVTERESIYIYSLEDFHLIKKIGKKGEGPGEYKINPFGQPLIIYPFDNKFVVNSYSKLTYFTQDGELIKEKKIRPFWMYQPFGDKFVALGFVTNKNNDSVLAVILCDEKFKFLKHIYISDINIGLAGRFELPSSSIAFQIYKNKLYVAVGHQFTIDVFDQKGNKLNRIQKEYQRIPVSKDYEKITMDSLKSNPNFARYLPFFKSRIKFKSHFSVIQDMHTKNDRIYVITYKKKQNKTECIVLDLKGNELKRVFIDYPTFYGYDFKLTFFFHNQSFYNLVDNDDEEVWELHKQDIK